MKKCVRIGKKTVYIGFSTSRVSEMHQETWNVSPTDRVNCCSSNFCRQWRQLQPQRLSHTTHTRTHPTWPQVKLEPYRESRERAQTVTTAPGPALGCSHGVRGLSFPHTHSQRAHMCMHTHKGLSITVSWGCGWERELFFSIFSILSLLCLLSFLPF